MGLEQMMRALIDLVEIKTSKRTCFFVTRIIFTIVPELNGL
jgi:hypothetical protein